MPLPLKALAKPAIDIIQGDDPLDAVVGSIPSALAQGNDIMPSGGAQGAPPKQNFMNKTASTLGNLSSIYSAGDPEMAQENQSYLNAGMGAYNTGKDVYGEYLKRKGGK